MTHMKSIKELAPKPSDALQAMVDGLLNQSKRTTFEIDMNGYGGADKICYGCAATCTIQQLAGKNLIPRDILDCTSRAESLGFDPRELGDFEIAINEARMGQLLHLFIFYNLHYKSKEKYKYDSHFYLEDNDWREQLPQVITLIELLKSKGL